MNPGDALKLSMQFLDEFEAIHKRNWELAQKAFKKAGIEITPDKVLYGLMHDLVLSTAKVAEGIIPQAIEAGTQGQLDSLQETEHIMNLVKAVAVDLARRLSEAVFETQKEWDAMPRSEILYNEWFCNRLWTIYLQKLSGLRSKAFAESMKAAMPANAKPN